MKRRIAGTLAVLLILLTLTGCWSRVEINDRAFATALFVDKGKDGKTSMTIGFPLPNRMVPNQAGGASSGNPYTAVTREAATLADAFRLIQADLSREITWGMTRVVVIGEEYAKSGVMPLMEFLARQPLFQLKPYVYISAFPANDAAKLTPVFELFPSEVLREFGNQKRTLNTTVADLLMAIAEGHETAVGILRKDEVNMISEKGKPGTWVGTAGAAIIQNSRMVGTLSQRDTRAIMWMQRKMNDAVVTLSSPTDGKPVSIYIEGSKTKIKPRQDGEDIVFDVSIDALDSLLSTESSVNFLYPPQLAVIQQKFSNDLAGRINGVFERSKQSGSDIFQLREYLNIYKPKLWKAHEKDWSSYYREHVRLSIKVNVMLKRPGGGKNPVWLINKGEST